MSMVMRSACAWSASHMRHREALSETLRALAPVYKVLVSRRVRCVRPHACVSPWVRARARAFLVWPSGSEPVKFTLVPCSQNTNPCVSPYWYIVYASHTQKRPGSASHALSAISSRIVEISTSFGLTMTGPVSEWYRLL